LVLACKGFGSNPDMMREMLPEMRDAPIASHTGNDGSAIAWGRALGAYQGHSSWAMPYSALIGWAMGMERAIQSNALGDRFHRETDGYSEAAVKVLAQAGGVAWYVMDDPLLALACSFPDFVAAEAAGVLKTCADAAAQAILLGDADPTVVAQDCATAPRRPLLRPFMWSRSPARCSVPKAGWTSTPIAACCAKTAVRSPTFWPPVRQRAACRVMRCRATCRATALSAVGGGAIAAATAAAMVRA